MKLRVGDLDGADAVPARARMARVLLANAFLVSGVIHLVRPQTYTGIVPRFLPRKRELVYASGIAELLCASGLFRRARWAPEASALLLFAIWPANLQMAVDAQRGDNPATKVVGWARMPLQIPLIWAAMQARRDRPIQPV